MRRYFITVCHKTVLILLGSIPKNVRQNGELFCKQLAYVCDTDLHGPVVMQRNVGGISCTKNFCTIFLISISIRWGEISCKKKKSGISYKILLNLEF